MIHLFTMNRDQLNYRFMHTLYLKSTGNTCKSSWSDVCKYWSREVWILFISEQFWWALGYPSSKSPT